MLLAVALCDGEAVGYQLIYFGGDFVELDGAVKRKEDITYYPDDSVYIWDFCTAKEHECKGVQTFLIKKLLEHFKGRCIYTITALDNIRSVEIQEKLGFKRIGAFDSKCGPCGIYMKS